jgi:two-component system response regulator GlrR
MVDDVYIVEAPGVTAELSLSRMLTPDVSFRGIHATWANLPIHELSKRKRTLVVAVALPLPSAALQGLRALSRSDAKFLTLAAVPVGLSTDLLQQFRDVAGDLIFLPVRREELLARLHCLLDAKSQETAAACGRLTQEFALQQMVGTAPQFSGLLQLIARFGPTEAPVLLMGETGTGKELCARSLHALSRRQRGPFIPVDCGAVPEHLAESELFGHVRGAFTDAHRDHHGLIALADGGTLFLDEVDALSLPTQGKLLRLLQEGTYRPVGGERFAQANVRVLAATNCDLEKMVAAKQVRSDLYFRLNVLRLPLPPLRERCSDIPLLVTHFLERLAENGPPKVLTEASLRKLEAYAWPGNVRELLNVLQRAVVLAPGPNIEPDHILLTGTVSNDAEPAAATFRDARSKAIEAFERGYVQQMLQKHNGNVTHAARDASHDRRGFGRLARKYHLHTDSHLSPE